MYPIRILNSLSQESAVIQIEEVTSCSINVPSNSENVGLSTKRVLLFPVTACVGFCCYFWIENLLLVCLSRTSWEHRAPEECCECMAGVILLDRLLFIAYSYHIGFPANDAREILVSELNLSQALVNDYI